MNRENLTTARVIAVQDDIVSIETIADSTHPLTKNEVIYIRPTRSGAKHTERLKAEILRIHGKIADAQVYESTSGIGSGDPVEQTGEMLSVELGPGLLGQVYDGLQNPLDLLAREYGYFLPRGVDLSALDVNFKWSFTSVVQAGSRLRASSVIGTVPERGFTHKIMIPFDVTGKVEVTWIQEGPVTVNEPVAIIKLENGKERVITLKQHWPVRKPLSADLLKNNIATRQYPHEPLITHIRLIDTLFSYSQRRHRLYPRPIRRWKNRLTKSYLKKFGG